MRNPCLDEGILQSYYDGELEPSMLEHVASHLASCAGCEQLARSVESEIELATAAFSAEMSLPVPTERLRARLDEAIAGLQPQQVIVSESATTRLRAWFASLAASFNLTPTRAMGFASIAALLVLAAVVGGIVMRGREADTGFVAANVSQNDAGDLNFNGKEIPETVLTPAPIQKAKLGSRRSPVKSDSRGGVIPDPNAVAVTVAPKALPGEKNYLNAIALLSDAIEANGESTLKPTLLADYKRNLAVVDQAITATQRTARTNPKSADAAEMLYAAYQSKLELLSAVAEQSQPLVGGR
jgi:hypothetical protein